MNISSVIVIPGPEASEQVVAGLKAMAGVEVAVISPEGKLIVTIETEDDRETVRTFESITTLAGVMSASMVFHQQENEPEAEISLAA
ncbi:MAG: nitrate reductase biosynthesis protein [Pseudomonadota bacterium]